VSAALQNKRRALKAAITNLVRVEYAARTDKANGRTDVAVLAKQMVRKAQDRVDRAVLELEIAQAVATATAENRTAMIATLRIDQKRLQVIRNLCCRPDRCAKVVIAQDSGTMTWVVDQDGDRYYGDTFNAAVDNAAAAVRS
jgi:hypothetical protein